MIAFTEKILYRIKQDGAKINSRNDLENYIKQLNLVNELKRVAKDKFELALTRIFEIITYKPL